MSILKYLESLGVDTLNDERMLAIARDWNNVYRSFADQCGYSVTDDAQMDSLIVGLMVCKQIHTKLKKTEESIDAYRVSAHKSPIIKKLRKWKDDLYLTDALREVKLSKDNVALPTDRVDMGGEYWFTNQRAALEFRVRLLCKMIKMGSDRNGYVNTYLKDAESQLRFFEEKEKNPTECDKSKLTVTFPSSTTSTSWTSNVTPAFYTGRTGRRRPTVGMYRDVMDENAAIYARFIGEPAPVEQENNGEE